ncbi:hypothetical protein HXX76_011178 [Chlamydomonas incerta]|uniref:Uncharacterized protein n=1 Tax=Chlamydomonas incerta TaxID=51695 RepID=A0A835SKZ9_CHLIN|nr:hypothetical protein HXX76_011178 [Chlamydomonas incerta]|eukprot:KAG2428934.1 hypothetical protein HXX76_011178 [Chlamydomonas incerta]
MPQGAVPESKVLNTLNHLNKLKEVRILGPSPNDLIAEAFEHKAQASHEALRWKAQHLADTADEVRASHRFLHVGLNAQQPQPSGGDPLLADDDEDERGRMPAYRLGVDAFSDDEASQSGTEAGAAPEAAGWRQGPGAAGGEQPAAEPPGPAPGPPMRLMTVRPAALQALQLPPGYEGGAAPGSGGAAASPAGASTPSRSPAVSGKLPGLRLGGVSRVHLSSAEGNTGPLSTGGAGRSGGASPGGADLLGWSGAAAGGGFGAGAVAGGSGSMAFLTPGEMGDGGPRSPVVRSSMPGSLLPSPAGQALINAAASRFSGSGLHAAPPAPAAVMASLLGGGGPNSSTGGMGAPVSVSSMFAAAQGSAAASSCCASAPLPRLSLNLDRPSPVEAAAHKALVSPLPGGGRGANRLSSLDIPPSAATNITPPAFGADARAGSRSESPSHQLRNYSTSGSKTGSSPSGLRPPTGGEDGIRGGHLAPLPVAASRFAPAPAAASPLPNLPSPANRTSGLPSLNA